METTTIKLKKPIEFKKSDDTVEHISELVFRNETESGDIEELPLANATVGDLMRVAARLCGKPIAIIRKMDIGDLEEVLELVGKLVPLGRKIGSKE